MRVHVLHREQELPGTPGEVFPFFADARNLEALTPPLLRFRVVTPEPIAMGAGTLIDYHLRIHGIPIRWRTRIAEWTPAVRFVDAQLRGPYAIWHHTHEFAPVEGADPPRTRMRDTVRYAVGFGPFGELANRVLVARDVAAIFDHRAAAIGPLLERQQATDARAA